MHSLKVLALLSICTVSVRGYANETGSVSGAFALVSEASDDIGAAIDTATASLNFISRPIARNVIKSRHPRFSRVAIAHDGSEIVVTFDNLPPMRMPADGSNGKWTRPDGEVLTVNAQNKSRGLVHTILTDDTKRINDFSLDADGKRLNLTVRFTAEQLESPLQYRLVYQRADAR